MISVELGEYGRSPGHQLTSSQREALRRSGALTVEVSPEDDGSWQIRAAQHVGIIQAEGVEVRVHPKVPVRRLLFLLAYALDQSGWKRLVAGFEEADELVAAVALGFLHHAEQALVRGVLQGYRVTEEALPALRGRLREGDQMRRRFGLPLPLEVTYDDYTVDIAENRLLRSAARRLLVLKDLGLPARRRLRGLVAALDGVTELVPGEPLPQVQTTRLNARYEPALRLAELILRESSVDSARGGRSSVAFLFDMNRVFEDFLTAALRPALERIGGRAVGQHKDVLDNARLVQIRPDISWWRGRRCLSVVDAKYKRIVSSDFPNADIYQVVAYCLALRVATGHLVYAEGDEHAAVHDIRNTGLSIHVHAVDLDQAPEGLLAGVDDLAGRVAAGALISQP